VSCLAPAYGGHPQRLCARRLVGIIDGALASGRSSSPDKAPI